MIIRDVHLPVAEFADLTGWEAKPEGLCRGEACVPAPGALTGASNNLVVDVTVAAQKLGMPLVHDAKHNIWALGASTITGRALASAVAAFPSSLIDAMGRTFDFNSLRGRRIIMIAWASW